MSSCDSDLPTAGLFEGEQTLTTIRVIATLISFSVLSAWFTGESTRRFSSFFAHWLAGLVASIGYIVEDLMVTVCWSGSNLLGFIKALKFIELAAFNMFAVTNLAICVNLAFIVSSHRTTSSVKSASSSRLLLVFLAVSVAFAIPLIPLTESVFISATGFHVYNSDEGDFDVLQMFYLYVEFFVGICMFFIVGWLLLFRMKEVKECWKTHALFRFYVGPTLVGTAVHLSIGASGAVNIFSDEPLFGRIVWAWCFRYIQIALNTIVVVGVLRDGNANECEKGNAITGDESIIKGPGSDA